MSKFGLFSFAILSLAPQLSAQIVRHVPAQYASIQGAIAAAQNGDTVLVAPGTYVELIDFLGKAVTVKSSGGRDVTTISGSGIAPYGTLVRFLGGEGPASVFEGFTVRNGVGASTPLVVAGSGLVLPSGHAGGMVIAGGSPTIRDCMIAFNYATLGTYFDLNCAAGNVDCIASNAVFERTVFEGGVGQATSLSAPGPAAGPGAVLIAGGGSPTFTDCGFVNNIGGSILKAGAGGVQIRFAGATFRNCYIGANQGGGGLVGGTGGLDIVGNSATTVVLSNTIIAANATGTGSPVEPGSAQTPLPGAGLLVNGYAGAPNVFLDHCTIGGNSYLGTPPIGAHAGVMWVGGASGSVTIRNSVVWGNPTPTTSLPQVGSGVGPTPGITIVHSSIQNMAASAQNLLVNPDYVAFPYDLRLGRTSACIDAAVLTASTPATDAELDPRAFPFLPDLGADEFTLSATSKDGNVVDSLGNIVDTLFINGSSGTPGKVRHVPLNQSITLAIAQPPLLPTPAFYIILGYIGVPSGSLEYQLPIQIGPMVFPPNDQIPSPDPAQFWVVDSFSNPPIGIAGGFPAPFALTHAPGLPFAYRVTFQAVIEKSPGVFGVTNAVVCEVR